MQSALKIYRIPLAATVLAIVLSGYFGGLKMAVIVALLAVLEISISFDNAIVNAAVLKTMTEKWQKIFLTWGILIAVFGMRLVFPIVIVAVAAKVSIPDVIDLAINDQAVYADKLTDAYPVIASFGGMFLLMVFLNFFLDERKELHWLGPLERPISRLGHIDAVTSAIGVSVLLLLSQVVESGLKADVLVAGLAGLIAYLFSNGIAGVLQERLDEDLEAAAEAEAEEAGERETDPDARGAIVGAAAKGGLASFMYLELLDASFSFDGVIGAFAISTDIIVIAIGLGLGALFIRTMTVHFVHQGTLSLYRYLEHGAHWAIGILAILLFVGIEHHIPEVITGSLGGACIIASFVSSIRANRRDKAAGREPLTV